VLDDGTRLGYYDVPPRLERISISLSGEMLAVLDRLRTAYRRGELLNGIVQPAQFNAKSSTLRALVRRGALRQVGDKFLLLHD
jgi:hypothetical protein